MIVQGFPVLMLAIWKVRVIVTGTVKVLASITVAVKVALIAGLNVPLTPLIVTVLPVAKPCGCTVVMIVVAPVPAATEAMSVLVLAMPRVDEMVYAPLVGLLYGVSGLLFV